jgi:signal transduction histidine kinase/CheY-like chemotaxis protein
MNLVKVKSVLLVVFTTIIISNIFCGELYNIDFLGSDSITNDNSKAESLLNISYKLMELDEALSLNAMNQAYDIAVLTDDKELIARCNRQLGIILSKNELPVKSLFHLKNALKYYEDIGDRHNTAAVLIELGLTYSIDNLLNKSLLFLNSGLAEYSAINDTLGIIRCHTHLGQSYEELGNNDEAITNYKRAIQLAFLSGDPKYQAINYLNLCNLNIKFNHIDSLLFIIDKANKLIEINSLSQLKTDYHKTASNYYLIIKDTLNSINHLHEYINLEQSKTNDLISRLEGFLKKTKSVEPYDNTKSLLVFWVSVSLLIILLILTTSKIRNQKSNHTAALNKCKKEIEAFKVNTDNLDEKIKLNTKTRVSEIEEEIRTNKLNNTSIKNSYENLKQMNYLKDMFLSKISHEIRTPLNGILGFAEILETQLALMDENDLFDFASSITESGMSLVSLLNNILDISRLNSNNMELESSNVNPVDVVQAVADSYQAEANLKGLKLIHDSQPITNIYTDSHLLSKILSLIISNSVKFTEKGYIKISHSQDDDRKRINIYIKDTGIGIDKVYIDKVFEPFRQESLGYSTSYQGAGLGLPLAKKMTNKLEGNISVDSDKGIGTTVTINIPIKLEVNNNEIKVDKEKTKKSKDKNALPWEHSSILVVEDDAMNQILYRKILKKSKNLEIARDGKSALSIVEKHLGDNRFDFVLMDINLPAPWDGIGLMKEIRSQWPEYQDVPFIAQTAYAISGNRSVMLSEGFDEYITKPIIKNTLIETIKSVLLDIQD